MSVLWVIVVLQANRTKEHHMLETTERSEVPHTPYHRFDVRALDALTLFVPTVGYVSVNSPRTLYRSKRGITIQTAGETQRFPSLNTEVSSVVHQGETLTNDEDLFYALVPSVRQILDRLFEDLFTPDPEPEPSPFTALVADLVDTDTDDYGNFIGYDFD
jgi:hypothetical protein